MRLELRPTSQTDLHAVSRLERTDTAQWVGETGIGWHRTVLADPAQEHLLLTDGHRAAGFVVLADGPRRTLALRRMVVRSDLRGRGVGSALVRISLSRARDRGRRRIVLDVAPDNAPAQDLYAANGFAYLDRTSPFVGFDVPQGYRVMSRTVGRDTSR